MLLTLSANSLASTIGTRSSQLGLRDVPRFVSEEFGLHGLNLQTSFLKGWELPEIDALRDAADKSACPCLLLIEEVPQRIGDEDATAAEAAIDRMDRVLRVAHRLGCSGVAMAVADPGSTDAEDLVAEELKGVVARAERLEMNLLLVPQPGLTETPEQLTGLIRKVGGFRIGSFPDFEAAARSNDAVGYLRALTPYASAVCAASIEFDDTGRHVGFDLGECVQAIRSVGYDGTLSLEYRGNGDAVAAVAAMKSAIETFIEQDAE